MKSLKLYRFHTLHKTQAKALFSLVNKKIMNIYFGKNSGTEKQYVEGEGFIDFILLFSCLAKTSTYIEQ